MENSGDGDQARGVIHSVENPVVANTEPEITAAAFQLPCSGKPRVLRQVLEAVTNSIEKVRGNGERSRCAPDVSSTR